MAFPVSCAALFPLRSLPRGRGWWLAMDGATRCLVAAPGSLRWLEKSKGITCVHVLVQCSLSDF